MSLETVWGLVEFCGLCLLYSIAMPTILIIVYACIRWASAYNTDSFVDCLKMSAESFWDLFDNTL